MNLGGNGQTQAQRFVKKDSRGIYIQKVATPLHYALAPEHRDPHQPAMEFPNIRSTNLSAYEGGRASGQTNGGAQPFMSPHALPGMMSTAENPQLSSNMYFSAQLG